MKPVNGEPDKAPSFVEFCDKAIAAATVLEGNDACAANVVRVANAFAAVGLVKEDFTCDGYLGACVDMIEIDFALTPEDCLNDPNFDPNGGWQDNVPFGEWIVAQDASSGTGLTYEWTTNPDDLFSSDPEPGECTPSSDVCKRFRWFVAGPKDITLTITDANGCVAVQTKTITVIDDTNFDCELAFDIVPIQPYTQCNDVTPICADSNTGQITLIPNEFYLGDISCYNFELINSSGIMIDDTPIIYANGSVIFECLPPDDYDIDIYNDMYDCIVHPITTLNPVSAPSEVIVPYQENSYYSISFGNGDLCERLAEIVAKIWLLLIIIALFGTIAIRQNVILISVQTFVQAYTRLQQQIV